MKNTFFCATKFGLLLTAAVLAAATTPSVLAQGRSGRSNFDPAEALKRLDANKNGIIEPSEMGGREGPMVQKAAQEAGLDPKQPLPIDKLEAALRQRQEKRGDRNSDRSGDKPADKSADKPSDKPASASSKAPAVPTFGEKDTRGKVAVFDGSPTGQLPLEQRFDIRVIEYVDKMLSEQDKNKDGFIDSEEWKAGKWSSPPEESDTNKDKRLSKEELCVRIAKKFGVNPSGTQPGSPTSGESAEAKKAQEQFRGYAEGLIKQHDKNKDGMLQRDEQSDLKPEHRSADLNSDGVITLDELVAKIASYAANPPGGATVAASTKSTSAPKKQWWKNTDTSVSKPVEKKSYKALTPAQRLPKGMPDWFLRSDTDGDGQILMSEYAASWSESKALEFEKYDLDGDGVIIPEECLAVEKKK